MEKLTFNHSGEILGKVDENGNIKLTDAGRETFSTIIIPLEPRTKKNSQQIRKNRATGQRYVAPSNTFLVYQNQCFPYLYRLQSNAESLQYPLNIKCLFYMPTHRRVDLVNLLEAIDDILVHYKLIVDDCAAYIGGHDGSRVLYDKENPRTEIYITTLDGKPIIV